MGVEGTSPNKASRGPSAPNRVPPNVAPRPANPNHCPVKWLGAAVPLKPHPATPHYRVSLELQNPLRFV